MIYVGVKICIQEYNNKVDCGYEFEEFEMQWRFKTAIRFSFWAALGGFVTGFVGLSGASLLNPIMLEMDLIPEISSSTTISMIIVNSISMLVDYSVNGGLKWDYGLILAFCTFIGSFVGIQLIRKQIRKVKRQSYIVFSLSAMLALGNLANLGKGVWDIIRNIHDDVDMMVFG